MHIINDSRAKFPEVHREPLVLCAHGRTRTDPYRWMHRLDDPRMQALLRANNDHAEAAMRDLRPLREAIEREMADLTPADEGTPEWVAGGYVYRKRFDHDREFPVQVRRRLDPPGPEETILDLNERARGLPFYACGEIHPSPRHDYLAFAEDTAGACSHTLRIRHLPSGELLPDAIPGVDAACAWANDNRTIFYVRLEPGTFRPYQVCRHRLGTDPAQDPIVYEERDRRFRCLLFPTRTRRFILLDVFANRTEEVHYLDADAPDAEFVRFCPRIPGHQYELDDDGERFWVRTNWQAPDFRLCEARVAPHDSPAAWREAVPEVPGRPLETMAAFRHHVVMTGFDEGRQRLFVYDRRQQILHEVPLPDANGHVWLERNPAADAQRVRVGFTSLKTPATYCDCDLASRRLAIVQREDAPGYAPERYRTECRWAEGRDGTRIPVSLVGRRDVLDGGPAPLLLFGYGAYGVTLPLYFDQYRLALLERGFVYAVAHVRGGGEFGERWHREGSGRHKQNTINDFIDCAEFLVQAGVARRDRLFAESLSAGGLLIGAVANQRPDLFRGLCAMMPFVDLLNSMADPNLPWTSFETDEWGDPADPGDWAAMHAYSPYDNIVRQPYPHLLATAAANDSQVSCWEPVKWVSRLRENNTADTQVLLLAELAAGHAGASGRQARRRALACQYAFLLALAGLAD